jgi:hypothetical protein
MDHGVVHLDNFRVDAHEEILKGKRQLAQRLASHIMGLRRRSNSLNARLLFVGGGAIALQAELKEHFPDVTVAADVQLANARGMWKHAELSERAAMEREHPIGASKGSIANVTSR